MSANNEDDKGDISKVYPLDLVSKLNVKPVTEIPKGTPLLMNAQPLRRVLTQTVSGSGSSSNALNIVPQTMIKSQGAVVRPAQITLAASGATYHVPRGPATVANLATPRSAVATPVRSTGATSTGQQATGSGFVATVRQVTPLRTPSPATTTTWLSGNMQIQSQQIVKNTVVIATTTTTATATAATTPPTITSASVAPTQLTTNLQRISAVVGSAISRTQILTRTTQTTSSVNATPLASSPSRAQAVLHSATIIGQQNPQQIHAFKPTGSIQTIGNTASLAQVLPTRPQTLVYSTGNTQGQHQQQQHFTARSQQIAIGNNQRQITTTTPRSATQVMGARLAVPVSVSQASSARLTVAPGSATIYATGARLSAHTQNLIAGSSGGARINVPNIQQANVNRSTGGGTLLTTTQATRITVANANAPQQQQQQSAVVIGTQAGGRLAASVVSLHPVVVAAAAAAAANSSQGTRQTSQGSKIIAQANTTGAIQLAQVPTVGKLPVLGGQQSVAVATASTTTRTINVTPGTIISQRPVSVVAPGAQGISIPIGKVFPQGNTNNSNNTQIIRRATSPVPSNNSNQSETPQRQPTATTSVGTYSLSSGTTYYYDTGSAFSVSGSNLVAAAAAPYTTSSSSSSFAAVPQSTVRSATQVHGIMSGQSLQFSPLMVVEQKRGCSQFLETSTSNSSSSATTTPITTTTTATTTTTTICSSSSSSSNSQQEHNMNPLPSIGKVTSSPRPSILRKRDNDGSAALKAAKNLAPLLSNISGPPSPPSRPLSRDNNGNSSGGSTTISATSSPGLGEIGDDSLPLPPVVAPPAPAQVALKLVEAARHQEEDHRPPEMSPRKKPRKQQLIGNDEPKFNIDDMQFLSENKVKKESDREQQQQHVAATIQVARASSINNEVTVKKPQTASLLNSYRQTWKSTHNHYLRYTDVKPKDERRPTIIDLANQTQVMQKINGWKIHHLSTQMEDLCDLETQVYNKLSTMLKLIETKESCGYDKEFNRINELIKGNMQRSKIINDSTSEAKTQVMKIFDHKEHVADIIQRCASKRNFKKREK